MDWTTNCSAGPGSRKEDSRGTGRPREIGYKAGIYACLRGSIKDVYDIGSLDWEDRPAFLSELRRGLTAAAVQHPKGDMFIISDRKGLPSRCIGCAFTDVCYEFEKKDHVTYYRFRTE